MLGVFIKQRAIDYVAWKMSIKQSLGAMGRLTVMWIGRYIRNFPLTTCRTKP